MQISSKTALPSWLCWLVIGLVAGHFLVTTLHQVALDKLPSSVATQVDRYTTPWFYQNYIMFAPDPKRASHTFLFRTRSNGEWSPWKDPAYPHLLDHWNNRFSTGSDMHDMITGIADELYHGMHLISYVDNPTDQHWNRLTGVQLARRYILRQSAVRDARIDAWQAGVWTDYHHLRDGVIQRGSLFQPCPVQEISDVAYE